MTEKEKKTLSKRISDTLTHHNFECEYDGEDEEDANLVNSVEATDYWRLFTVNDDGDTTGYYHCLVTRTSITNDSFSVKVHVSSHNGKTLTRQYTENDDPNMPTFGDDLENFLEETK